MMKQKTQPGRLTRASLETADDMCRVGIMNAANHEKITLRHLGSDACSIEPLSGDEIRARRASAPISARRCSPAISILQSATSRRSSAG
jgi:putative transcriptional regulator